MCKQEKPLSEFGKNRSRGDGHAAYCKVCFRRYQRGRPPRVRSDEARKNFAEYHRKWCKDHLYRKWAQATLRYHRSKYNVDMNVNILEERAKQTTRCELCGIELQWAIGHGISSESPTLDRRDNGDTLTADTTMIICRRCNASKQDRSLAEFVEYCNTILEKWKS